MKKCRLLLAAGLLMFLTGCFPSRWRNSTRLPKPDDYLKLDNGINKVLTQGRVRRAPQRGADPEGAASGFGRGWRTGGYCLFRVSADERPLKIYIYRQVGRTTRWRP